MLNVHLLNFGRTESKKEYTSEYMEKRKSYTPPQVAESEGFSDISKTDTSVLVIRLRKSQKAPVSRKSITRV